MSLPTKLSFISLAAAWAGVTKEGSSCCMEKSSTTDPAGPDGLKQILKGTKGNIHFQGGPRSNSIGEAIRKIQQQIRLSSLTPLQDGSQSDSLTPLKADQISRTYPVYEILPLSKDRPLKKVDHQVTGPDGSYTIRFEIPDGLFSKDEQSELVAIVADINQHSEKPLTLIRWDNENEPGHYYPAEPNRGQYISMGLVASNPARDELGFTKSILTHEMMHSLFEANFRGDKDFIDVIYPFLLGAKNYEIIDDSNFEPGINDRGGHPYAKPHEAFASAAAAYYSFADKLVAFIENPDTPNAMKIFGKLVWCYLRDRVFHQVFTSDGTDPFAEESLDSLLKIGKGARTKSLLLALDDDEATVRWRAEDLIRGNPKVLDVDELKQWRKGHPNHKSHPAVDVALLVFKLNSP